MYSRMTIKKTRKLVVRLSEEDYEKLERYAAEVDIPMSQVIRQYIKELPETILKCKLPKNSALPEESMI